MKRFSAIARISAILMFAVAMNSGAAFGQQVTGTILGRVTDTSGAVVPGAAIQILNPATGFSRSDTADADGRYFESNLPLGTYSVTVQKQGFQTLVHSGIELTVGSQMTVNAELVLGDVQQHVEVTGEVPQIETTNATISGLVSQDQLRDLPLNGRNVDQLALLSPGIFANHVASQNTTVGLGLHIAVNGARQDWNLYLLDGTVTNDVLSGRSSAAGQALGVEGILEFRVLTHSFSAEYGRTAGGIFSAVTRSGTNQLHGSAYEFVRNTIFDARNYFTPENTLPVFQRNQFGAAVGGPIFKNKLFFFANYEGLRSRQQLPITSFVPDANARLGIIPGQAPIAVTPTMQKYLAQYPSNYTPGTDLGGIAQALNNFIQPIREDYTMVRLDYKISDKDSAFGRYVYDPSSVSIPQPVPTFVANVTGDDRLLVLGETHVFSTSTLNEFRFSLNRTFPTNNSVPTIPIDPALSFVPGQVFGSITYSAATNGANALSSLGTSTSNHQTFAKNLISETDAVTIVKGAHTIKFGVDVEREQINALLCVNCLGTFQFSGLPGLLASAPTNYVVQVSGLTTSGVVSNPERGWRRTLFGSFVQDDIRLRPNLTVNLGLRYEFMTTPTEVNGLSAALINVTDAKNTVGPPFLSPKLNFAPRVGLAWDPTGSGKTSIRLGGGVYDNQLDDRQWFSNATNNANFLVKYQVANPPFPNGLMNGTGTALVANQQVQFNSKEPVLYEWNLEVQRQLAPTLSLRVGYVGSHGENLPIQVENNTKKPIFNPDGSVASFTATAINPNFASIQTTMTEAVSNYNGLQVLLEKTASAGLTFQASYTYSRALSNGDQTSGGSVGGEPLTLMNPFNPAQDYSLSGFDQRHTLVVNGAYKMPWDHLLSRGVTKAVLGGWAVNGIFSYGSGLPVDILSGFNSSKDGDTSNPDRPSLAPGYSNNPNSGVTQGNTPGNPACTVTVGGVGGGGPAAGQPLHTPSRWFDPCAFLIPPSTTSNFGNLGRNTVIGPRLSNIDLTLVKMTALTERAKLEFRAEVFNLVNHANFGAPSNSISSSAHTYNGNAGVISNTITDNRELQLGLKLLF